MPSYVSPTADKDHAGRHLPYEIRLMQGGGAGRPTAPVAPERMIGA